MEGAHPLAVVTLPALLREGVTAGVDVATTPVEFGSGTETNLLDDYFKLPRPPETDRPWRAPWSSDPKWQKRKYPGGGLQRLRRDASGRGEVFVQRKTPGQQDRWGITPQAGHELMSRDTVQYEAVRLVDLALWFGREVDTDTLDPAAVPGITASSTDLDKLMAWFTATFEPDRADLIGTVFLTNIPADYLTTPFEPAPIDDATAIQLGSLPPAPSVSADLANVVVALEGRLNSAGYHLPAGLVRRVMTAWLRGDMVILVGQPGTGKSFFANLLGRAMEAEYDLNTPLVIPVSADFDEAEFIGYERLDGEPQLRDFATQVLLTDTPLEARVVVLEEFNLASIESYMASVLVATQDQDRIVRLPSGTTAHLPVDTFLLATCNSFRDEPETRTRVSSPTKRRATTITMPNVLGDRYDADPDTAVLGLVLDLIDGERRKVAGRRGASRASQFDSLRQTALDSVTSMNDLSQEVRAALQDVSTALLGTTTGRSWFTLGILRDVVLEVALADRTAQSELEALGNAVADKLVHQLRGPHSDAQDLMVATATLPNAEEIARLIEQAKSGPSDELLPLL